jgi:peroxiredoxin
VGKRREGEFLSKMYARTDFTLLDDDNEFFRLKDFPKEKLLLLVFTPDGLSPSLVETFRAFSARVKDLRAKGVEVMMVSRTNRDTVHNFRNSVFFPGRVLIDTSGTVGRNIGIWDNFLPVDYWGYALVDGSSHVYWTTREPRPLTYDEVWAQLKKMK